MPEYLYRVASLGGKPVQGILVARSKGDAKSAATKLCKERKLRLIDVVRKSTFMFRVTKKGEPLRKGEEEAFFREEVDRVLKRQFPIEKGYKVSVQKKLLDFNFKPPTRDIVLFVRICADLLREKLPYDEILALVLNDTTNKTLRRTISQINSDLKDGKDGKEVFQKHEQTIGKFPAYMLGIASSSGNMAEVYDSTAKFLERDQEFQKNLRGALITPVVTLLLLMGAVIYYVGYIFPKTAEVFERLKIKLPPMTRASLAASDFLTSHMALVVAMFVLPPVVLAVLVRTPKGKLIFDRLVIRIPVLGSLIHKMSIEIFARVFNALYTGSGENIAVIRTAAEACRNKYMEERIKTIAIPVMLKEGRGLVEALEATKVFTVNAISRFRSGSESGALKSSSEQLANYYEKETGYKMKSTVEMINLAIAFVIMIVTLALTLVSSETAFIKPDMGSM